MTHSPESLSHALIDAAKAAGADSADAMVAQGSSLSIEVHGGKLEHAERAEAIDLGLRVFIGQQQALVSASDARPETIQAMAERAIAMAKEAPADPYAGLADPADLAQDWDLAALELADPADEPAPDALHQDALAAEAACLAVDGISQVQAAGAGYGQNTVHLAASNGFSGGYQRTTRSLSCTGIAGTGTGMERDYDGDSRTFQSDLRSAQDIGHTAGVRAVSNLNARKPETGSFPILFDERISSSLIGHLLSAANGAAIARGASWLKDSLGEQVLSESLSVLEDPFRPRVPGSRPFDGEGLPTRKRAIVENGVLTGWTLDQASARKLNLKSTGNATRGIGSVPSPSNWNIALTPGERSREDLIRDMGTGLLVTSMIGSTINGNTGDYSRGASGFWVENGEITHPVNECTIAGNLKDMLLRLNPANDGRSYLSRVIPSLLVEGMTLPATDLDLLIRAAEQAGDIASKFTGSQAKRWDKPDGAGPVTEADLEVNAFLEDYLQKARPDYGWLSEESTDTQQRLSRERTFIIDPIDGTRSFMEGSRTWAHALAVAERGVPVAAVVFLPQRDLIYTAATGKGTHRNGRSVTVSTETDLDRSDVLAARPHLDPKHWRQGLVPGFRRNHRPSLAYRLATVAEGRFDAMLTLRASWEWDIAAGDLLIREAGGICGDRGGKPLRFNNPHPQVDGVVCANPGLYRDLLTALAPLDADQSQA